MNPYQRGAWRKAGGSSRGAELHEALNAVLKSSGLNLKLWEPYVIMVGLCIPETILRVSVEHKDGDRGPVKRLV